MLSEFPNDKELNVAERITRDNITNRLDEVSIMLMTKMQSELSIDDPRYEAVSAQATRHKHAGSLWCTEC
jgi:hypothetical protein